MKLCLVTLMENVSEKTRGIVSLPSILGGPWNPQWEPQTLTLFFFLSIQLHVKPKKIYFYCISRCSVIVPSAAKVNRVCSCDSSAMACRRSRRPTVPTRTRWARPRVCLSAHTDTHTPLLFILPLSLFTLWTS